MQLCQEVSFPPMDKVRSGCPLQVHFVPLHQKDEKMSIKATLGCWGLNGSLLHPLSDDLRSWCPQILGKRSKICLSKGKFLERGGLCLCPWMNYVRMASTRAEASAPPCARRSGQNESPICQCLQAQSRGLLSRGTSTGNVYPALPAHRAARAAEAMIYVMLPTC